MREKLDPRLEATRQRGDGPYGSDPWDGANGAFLIEGPGPTWITLRIIASDGTHPDAEFWEHVSVSTANRCPNWPEMCFVKSLFWADHETVIQFHPAKDDYVNHHPYTLHLWRHRSGLQQTPPSWLVGPKD
jgi:hypothetical protein